LSCPLRRQPPRSPIGLVRRRRQPRGPPARLQAETSRPSPDEPLFIKPSRRSREGEEFASRKSLLTASAAPFPWLKGMRSKRSRPSWPLRQAMRKLHLPTVNFVSAGAISNPGALTVTLAVNSPDRLSGTRHECGHRPCQSNSNLALSTCLPSGPKISIVP
jgi:hypothetical protein